MRVFLAENRKLNLSAYRTEETCWPGNILDSIAAFPFLLSSPALSGACPEPGGCKILDLGTGGGFPLLPLALLLPEMHFTGLDATKKKIDAVQRMANTLGLSNVRLLIGRAEELGHEHTLREQFDVVLSRAVAPLSVLLEYMSPFVRVGGKLLCWKSISIEKELLASIPARMKLQCRLTDRHVYNLPDDWGERQILVFEKTGKLSGEFPRGVGEPKKHPL